jgi:hypothetical protein
MHKLKNYENNKAIKNFKHCSPLFGQGKESSALISSSYKNGILYLSSQAS